MPHVNLYGISNCGSVKKARNYLDSHRIDYLFFDFKKIDVSELQLANWLTQLSINHLINRASLTWRELDAATKIGLQDVSELNNSAYIKLMQNQPTVIKRPILEKDGKIISVGFDAEYYAKLFEFRA